MGVMTQFEELAKKDDEILLLETRIQAYIARTSLLQTRLLSALDTLDAQQAVHAKELLALAQDRERLKAKVRRYAEVVTTAEEERDDMRDAVLKLIEKVEISNDYSKWPHSQISLSSLADVHIKPSPLLTHHPAFQDTEDRLKYATTMLKTVLRERDSEKRAHELTREAFEAHILALEAKLSRRDAELESCVASAGHGASLGAASPTWDSAQGDRRTNDRQESWSQDRREISSEEMIGMLDVTAARNKVLEAEIKILARRLDQARAAAAATPDPAFSTAFGLPRASSRSSPAPLSPSRPQPRRRPLSQQPRSNRHFSPCHDDDNASTANPTPEVLEHPFKALERQIRELSSKIDGFAQERQLILGGLGLNGGFQEQGDDENFWPETPAVEEQFELENEQLRRRETPERSSGRRNIRRAEEPRPADDNREDGDDDDGLYERLRLLEEEYFDLQKPDSKINSISCKLRLREGKMSLRWRLTL
ncbi:hypothetical protein NLJ89_g6165 [Agrocybe chaxingu]|uniref:Uncharacterized protein n=1 Tax=Agrocybe chaxingu TaxID=84603 RepID=A0A9W8K193_9AGAR|nr:hypothetical protein NLJ89_g6165 [Agrocybe chaxingu]